MLGDDIDAAGLKEYIEKACAKAGKNAGVSVVLTQHDALPRGGGEARKASLQKTGMVCPPPNASTPHYGLFLSMGTRGIVEQTGWRNGQMADNLCRQGDRPDAELHDH